MAILKDGVNGGFTGKVGSVIGYQLGNQWVIKGLPRRSRKNKTGTVKQNKCRAKFRAMQRFLSDVLTFINVGFNTEARSANLSPHNKAKSYNMLYAFDDEGVLNYSAIRVSMGILPVAEDVEVSVTDSGLQFNWQSTFEHYELRSSDQVMLLAFNPLTHKVHRVLSGERRWEQEAVLEIHELEKGSEFHTWISFIADDRMSVANSVYTGLIKF